MGNERSVHSATGKLSADSEFDPSDVTIPVWPLPDWCKGWDVARKVRDPSETIDEDSGVLDGSEWSKVPSQFIESDVLDGTRS